MFLKKALSFFHKKDVHKLITIKKITDTYFLVKAKNGLIADVKFQDNDMFVVIKDIYTDTFLHYFTKKNDLIDNYSFVYKELNKNIFFKFDIRKFQYLKNRYTFTFNNAPNVLNMLLSDESKIKLETPNVKYLDDIFYPEIIIREKTVIKNFKKTSFCLYSSSGKIISRSNFYELNDYLFEVGRFSEFNSLSFVKPIVTELSFSIDTKLVKILKHKNSPCLIIKDGLNYKIIFENFDEYNSDMKKVNEEYNLDLFSVISYEKGNVSLNNFTYNKDDYENYSNNFYKFYISRFNYLRSQYPSYETIKKLKELKMSTDLPLSSDILNILSMYEI